MTDDERNEERKHNIVNLSEYIEQKLEASDLHGEARKFLQDLPAERVKQVIELIANLLLDEIKAGVVGDIDEDDAPFFKLVDMEYEKVRPKGCYFCDSMIDPNETEFNLDTASTKRRPGSTRGR